MRCVGVVFWAVVAVVVVGEVVMVDAWIAMKRLYLDLDLDMTWT